MCNNYFLPSIEYLSFEKLHLSSHVAGATILAAASSGSELCTSMVGVFFAKNDLSINMLVGAGSYNLLVITTICCFCVYKFKTKLYKFQILRDSFFYSLNLILLVFFLTTNKYNRLYWYQSLTCILVYVIFILVNIFDSDIRERANKWKNTFCKCFTKRKKT